MATLTAILGKTVYLDTNIFIYTVEGYAPEEAFLRELFAALEDARFTAITSELSLAEVLVKPFELGHEDVAAAYQSVEESRLRSGGSGSKLTASIATSMPVVTTRMTSAAPS